jgi:flagellar basal body-associated protein FliL
MKFLEKLENIINTFLIRIGESIIRSIPSPLKKIFNKIPQAKAWLIAMIKNLPSLLKALVTKIIAKAKSLNWKSALLETYERAMSQYKDKSQGSLAAIKRLIFTPFLLIGQWLTGLTTTQATMLLMFSAGSILSVIGIISSGQRISGMGEEQGRTPASEEVAYERPEYYKKQLKHFEITNLRLPVYFAKVNEIRTVDIDFIATISNRSCKKFLEKYELQLRDHLILQVEPSVASFPLEEEGREIIRQKLTMEINDFLKTHEVEGEVVELKITYVLAN